MSAANRKRGQRAEVAVVNYLRTQGWPDARRYLSGDGRQPGDIDWHPLICLEVKDVAASAWPTWCRQAFAEAPAGTVPVVVRRTRGVADVGMWECRVHEESMNAWLGIYSDEFTDTFHTVAEDIWVTYPFAALPLTLRLLDGVRVSDHLRPSSDVTGCTDPQPIPVRTGAEQVAVFCSACRYRTPVVADRRTARQEFDRAHGATT